MGKHVNKTNIKKESNVKKINNKNNNDNSINKLVKSIKNINLDNDDINNKSRWLDCTLESKPNLSFCTFTLIDNGNVIIFGGENNDGLNQTTTNDTYLYNLETNIWKILECKFNPLGRCSHEAVYYKNRVYIFGGESIESELVVHNNDMYYLCLETLTWNYINQQGNIPTPRSGHRMVLWKNYWILFGGFVDNGTISTYYNTLYYYDLDNNKWYYVDQKLFSESLPEPRSGCILLTLNDNKHIMMHGGFSKIDKDNFVTGISHKDTWLIDMNSVLTNNPNILVWSKVKSNYKPEFTTGLTYASNSETAYIFGGVKDEDKGLSLKSTFSNQCLVLNLNQRKYNPVLLQNNNTNSITDNENGIEQTDLPRPRMHSRSVLYNNKLYIYGGIVEIGNIEITLTDIWSLDLKTNIWYCIDKGFDDEKINKCKMELEDSMESELSDEESDSIYDSDNIDEDSD